VNVLGIDTAGPVTGLALVRNHSEWLWSRRMVKGADAHLLEQLETISTQYSIDCIAVTVGPGSFTSLRVGVSIALGFALAKGIKVVPASSLLVRASMFPHECCLALLDARRGKVYAQCFDSTADNLIALTSSKDVLLQEVLPQQTFIAVGEGAVVYRDEILAAGGFVPRDAARSPALALAKYGLVHADKAVEPNRISIDYIRGAAAIPPKQLGVPVGQPAIR
jgi:tRNA threonylcarbamoyladenosine biosynthesis protein TsaB